MENGSVIAVAGMNNAVAGIVVDWLEAAVAAGMDAAGIVVVGIVVVGTVVVETAVVGIAPTKIDVRTAKKKN